MAVYPAQLTVEEKNLKKRYAKLLEKRKQLLKSQEKPLLKSSSTKPSSGEILSPRDAMAAAKKLLEAGKLKLGKKNPVKKTGFKRVGETPNDAPPAKKALTVSSSPQDPLEQQQQQQKQRKVVDQINYQKSLYKRTFVKGSTARDIERIPKKQEDDAGAVATTDKVVSGTLKERTVYVRVEFGPFLSEDALQKAFSRFGEIDNIELRPSTKSAFVSFVSVSCASAAVRKMNRGMIRGHEVIVQPAGDENHFVELAGEAASNPWAVIAAGKEVSAPSVKKAQAHRTQKSYANIDF